MAAGLGGGSSDAAAALRALALENALSFDDPRLKEAARGCGADVLVCLDPRARVMTGIGDILRPALATPPLHAVLVNPRVAVATAAVFARLGLAKGERAESGPSPALRGEGTQEEIIAALRIGRNDMQKAAQKLAPVIGDVIEALEKNGARARPNVGIGSDLLRTLCQPRRKPVSRRGVQAGAAGLVDQGDGVAVDPLAPRAKREEGYIQCARSIANSTASSSACFQVEAGNSSNASRAIAP